MKTVTINQAKAAAKRGLKPALRNVIKRWKQMAVMTKNELRDSGYMNEEKDVDSDYCAVCHYHISGLCDDCVLYAFCNDIGMKFCCRGAPSYFADALQVGTARTRRQAANKVVAFVQKVLKATQ